MTRIQRSRARGWRLPDNAVCITRPGPWGNPFVVGVDGPAAECVRLYRMLLGGYVCWSAQAPVLEQRAARTHFFQHWRELVGRDLACWCRLSQPCHGDVLIEAVALMATSP